jgi:hypothetical protein
MLRAQLLKGRCKSGKFAAPSWFGGVTAFAMKIPSGSATSRRSLRFSE